MLTIAPMPLSDAQITDFLVEKNYCGYFPARQALAMLEDQDLVVSATINGSLKYILSAEGSHVFNQMQDKLNAEVLKDVRDYFEREALRIEEESGLSATYSEDFGGGYLVQLSDSRTTGAATSLSFHVGSKAVAEAMCLNWKTQSEKVYETLLDLLV